MATLVNGLNGEDQVGIFLKLYSWLVLNSVLIPWSPYRVNSYMLGYIDIPKTLGQYMWVDAVWRDDVQTLKNKQRKLGSGPLSEI